MKELPKKIALKNKNKKKMIKEQRDKEILGAQNNLHFLEHFIKKYNIIYVYDGI